jgi:aryl-alcohol dehydrogenase-like predicted oxidoreductase
MTDTHDARSPGPGPHFVLGTVQLGLPYGIANRTGQPDPAEAGAILATAFAGGVRWLDTARAYGDSEARIATALRAWRGDPVLVATKLDPLAALDVAAPAEAAVAAAEESVARSCTTLGLARIDSLLLHRAWHRTGWGGAVWAALRRLRDAGRIARLGVSVASPEELDAALDDADVAHVQLPFNLLDWRWATSGSIARLRAARPRVCVHVRSVLLQGLLADRPGTTWPTVAGGEPPARVLDILRDLARNTGHANVTALAIAYARAQDWIDGIVMGVETLDQLQANLVGFQSSALGAARADELARAMPSVPEELLDPARWPVRRGTVEAEKT